MRTKPFTKVVIFLGIKLKCKFVPVPFGYRSELSPQVARECYREALRFLFFNIQEEGTKLKVSSGYYKSCEPEYKVKLTQAFNPSEGNPYDNFEIEVVVNKFPDSETYIFISESYLLCK